MCVCVCVCVCVCWEDVRLWNLSIYNTIMQGAQGFPGGSVVESLPANVGDMG